MALYHMSEFTTLVKYQINIDSQITFNVSKIIDYIGLISGKIIVAKKEG